MHSKAVFLHKLPHKSLTDFSIFVWWKIVNFENTNWADQKFLRSFFSSNCQVIHKIKNLNCLLFKKKSERFLWKNHVLKTDFTRQALKMYYRHTRPSNGALEPWKGDSVKRQVLTKKEKFQINWTITMRNQHDVRFHDSLISHFDGKSYLFLSLYCYLVWKKPIPIKIS